MGKDVQKMKRFLSMLMVVMLVAGLATCVMAAEDYDRSPGASPLPEKITIKVNDPEYPAEIISTEKEDGGSVVVEIHQQKDNCYDDLIITPYSGKNEMVQVVSDMSDDDPDYKAIAQESKQHLEDAYKEVMAVRNNNGLLTDLKPLDNFKTDLENAARRAGTTVPNIYVSDLFDITFYECISDENGAGKHTEATPTTDGHEEQDPKNDLHARTYSISVSDYILKNFVALLHRPSDMNGKWEVVDATVDRVNNTISFKINVVPRATQDQQDKKSDEVNLSPFAIVVKKTEGDIGGPTSPKTADPVSLLALGAAMVASAGGITVLNKRKHD